MRTAVPIALAALAAAGPLAAQKRAASPPAAVAQTGGEQAIRIGKTVVPRPFGAELVDRLVLAGTYRLGGRRIHLVRGDASGPCPSRFVFVSEQPGSGPAVSTPFGTCSGAARVRLANGALVVSLPAAAGGPMVRFAFDGAVVRPLDGPAHATAAAEPGCIPASHTDAATQAETVAAFEREYPVEFRNRGRINKIDIGPDEMRTLVTALACLAPWPAAERRVPKVATPLFASRHGPAAFAALDAIAQSPASDAHLRALARSFAAEMNYQVDRYEPGL
jgi:hypothetical protein